MQIASGLSVSSEKILIVSTSRLVHQKCIDQLISILPQLLKEFPKVQICILGQGSKVYETQLLKLEAQFPKRMALHLEVNEELFHLAVAGGDILIMGSRFEPCGISQQYALKYGCIPVASRVGGLIDTINDFNESTKLDGENPNGFLFDNEEENSMLKRLIYAMTVYEDRDTWKRLQRTAMQSVTSWDTSSRSYIKIYNDILNI